MDRQMLEELLEGLEEEKKSQIVALVMTEEIKIARAAHYMEFEELLRDLKEPTKTFIMALVKDFVWIDAQIEELRRYPTYIINPKNPRQQKKLEAHSMLKDLQAQKSDIATKILRSLDGTGEEESALAKALAKFNE